MQIVRTVVWVLLLLGLVVFSIFNWVPVTVTIWENLVLETKIPVLMIISFLIGLVPMWLYHRGSTWATTRRINSLENAARMGSGNMSAPTPTPAPVATSNTNVPKQETSSSLSPDGGETK
jgi:hypothetical protein